VTTYKILYWQEIPTQIKAEDESDDVTVMLDDKIHGTGGYSRRQTGTAGADDYLAQWKWSEEEEREGSAQRSGGSTESRTRSEGLVGTSQEMAVTLTINGQSIEATDGRSLFDHAEAWASTCPHPAASKASAKSAWSKWLKGWMPCRRLPSRNAI
jgi:hypothetical protein